MSTATTTGNTFVISDELKRQYIEEGYFILPAAIPSEHLEMLRDECTRFIDEINAEMDAAGKKVMGINHRDKRYFVANKQSKSELLRQFLFSDLMAQVCKATIGPDAFLFLEQYVVKSAEVGMKFAWHQDGGYIGHAHTPYLSAWCALDDMTEANGTIYVLPYDRAGTREYVPHRKEEGSNDMVGYFGDDPGIPVIVPAGSIVCFSSATFHRSGFNTTHKARRSYLCQYSPDVIMNKEGTAQWNTAVPFLKDGRIIYRGI
ncbi:MAG: phytanoyl-CoA dioxygenase family protein [Phycisphaerales bacterium]|jgi:ectoine hydroxylase-related dioxygenase (phytanoyl-CoA dioxygenase family)|nr:phytanoyl-CoA dioxygenase family protein [Phycisphaerales bacterium]